MPPFAGFWSKDEILLFAYDKSPVLWVVGLVTALLTAYYMTRQVIMVFFSEARWESHAEEHGAHGEFKPHESPGDHARSRSWSSPALSIVGGAISACRSTGAKHLERWLEPVVEGAEHHLSNAAEDIKWVLAAIAVVGAVVGHPRRHRGLPEEEGQGDRTHHPRQRLVLRPGASAPSWAARAARPSTTSRGSTRTWSTGPSTAPRSVSARWAVSLRKAQTGFVRNYALSIGVGVVALLGWFLIRGVL